MKGGSGRGGEGWVGGMVVFSTTMNMSWSHADCQTCVSIWLVNEC